MKFIKLTQNQYAIVDDEDFEKLNHHKWCATKKGNTYYVRRGGNPRKGIKQIMMHREIMDNPMGLEIDHIDGNGLNNQRSNLRICTHRQNLWNSRPYNKNTSSTLKGVHWCKARKRWIARVCINGKSTYIGSFLSEDEAGIARDRVARDLCGDFARTNFKIQGVSI